ncbi:Maf family protein [Qingshengfaniella alkalisoli]|uniref:dTTP/UTP pyrophosphatase n=1 Tax=Qingshengfaniella alkalisoli TaxID=2599296 RepID=A0A5B8IRP6_9RHOB|nr:Maf family protein [Qingshengfaniella alkalisoli]QDY68244.1 septum formation protein Maf [Qingshengfaniella alkalisoli]
MRLILGSGSPRRLELLASIGVVPDAVIPPDIDETAAPSELPRRYCERLAREKCEAMPGIATDDVVLCADTTVALGRRILGKPADRAEAAKYLFALSGRRHRVFTAIAVRHGDRRWLRVSESRVRMKQLSDAEVNAYLDTDDWKGKAGAYGIQGPASAFIPWISGSHSGIVGLPLHETTTLLQSAGYPVWSRA